MPRHATEMKQVVDIKEAPKLIVYSEIEWRQSLNVALHNITGYIETV